MEIIVIFNLNLRKTKRTGEIYDGRTWNMEKNDTEFKLRV